jgi:hypothetical protein
MHDRHIWLVGACALLSVGYILPSLIGLVRYGERAARLVVINVLLGWTLVGWVVGLVCACRPRHIEPGSPVPTPGWTPWWPGRPEAVELSSAAPACYADGTYLISECDAAQTWAIRRGGRWGVAYELDGVQRVGVWVDSSDIPVDVLAHALEPSSSSQDCT